MMLTQTAIIQPRICGVLFSYHPVEKTVTPWKHGGSLFSPRSRHPDSQAPKNLKNFVGGMGRAPDGATANIYCLRRRSRRWLTLGPGLRRGDGSLKRLLNATFLTSTNHWPLLTISLLRLCPGRLCFSPVR